MLLLDWFPVYNHQTIFFQTIEEINYELESVSNTVMIFRIIRYNVMACLRHKCLQFRQNRFFAWINFYHHSGSKDCCSPNGTFVCTVNLWWYINWICCNNSNFYFHLLSITIYTLQKLAKMLHGKKNLPREFENCNKVDILFYVRLILFVFIFLLITIF